MRCRSKLLSERLMQQDMLSWNGSQNKIVTLGCVELTKLVIDILSLVAKHLVTDRFKMVQVLAASDNRLIYELLDISIDSDVLGNRIFSKMLHEKLAGDAD